MGLLLLGSQKLLLYGDVLHSKPLMEVVSFLLRRSILSFYRGKFSGICDGANVVFHSDGTVLCVSLIPSTALSYHYFGGLHLANGDGGYSGRAAWS